ncbi:hypothetical protein PHLGIDRAFT_344355 [Phlebiopsis gigantea 11061_1 CR5-6]|uniref:Uncharacterized protein n=1 Tax=Phlebiopsis gigantea (strain 11061_1 CR5-6) TaxID=745531 RepID=A0A0C3S235_PHLG1|nr:hypothetical protein PHLGIDRAFT_344355 [Phlebiopsis gigantea 11061_1 CR5-6]
MIFYPTGDIPKGDNAEGRPSLVVSVERTGQSAASVIRVVQPRNTLTTSKTILLFTTLPPFRHSWKTYTHLILYRRRGPCWDPSPTPAPPRMTYASTINSGTLSSCRRVVTDIVVSEGGRWALYRRCLRSTCRESSKIQINMPFEMNSRTRL